MDPTTKLALYNDINRWIHDECPRNLRPVLGRELQTAALEKLRDGSWEIRLPSLEHAGVYDHTFSVPEERFKAKVVATDWVSAMQRSEIVHSEPLLAD